MGRQALIDGPCEQGGMLIISAIFGWGQFLFCFSNIFRTSLQTHLNSTKHHHHIPKTPIKHHHHIRNQFFNIIKITELQFTTKLNAVKQRQALFYEFRCNSPETTLFDPKRYLLCSRDYVTFFYFLYFLCFFIFFCFYYLF